MFLVTKERGVHFANGIPVTGQYLWRAPEANLGSKSLAVMHRDSPASYCYKCHLFSRVKTSLAKAVKL